MKFHLLAGWLFAASALAAEFKIPTVLDPQLQSTLVASEPDLVTPIGLAIDQQGKIFIVASHTHFPKFDYPGGKGVLIPASLLVSDQTSKLSLMPEGLENALTEQDFRDSIAFLLSLK